jgi:hypothetical protein
MNRMLKLVAAGLAAAAFVPTAGLSASPSPLPCSQPIAYAMFAAFLPLIDLRNQGLAPPPVTDVLKRCQYRFFPVPGIGDHRTFTEDDWVLGGIVYSTSYVADGVTRAAAVADLELGTDRVSLAKVQPNGHLGPAVEQPLMRTGYTDWNHSTYGLTVWQHRGFIRRFTPGDYVNTWVSSYPGFPDDTTTMYLHIVPRP